MENNKKVIGTQSSSEALEYGKDFANKMSEKLNGEQAGIITLVAVGIAGLAAGTVYLVKAGLKALSSENAA